MSEFNNKDPLEELFRKKTGDYDISYREDDWKQLENRLDALDAQYEARRYRRIAAAAVLIIFSLLSFFIYQNYRQIHSLNEQLEQNSEIVENPSTGEPGQDRPPRNNNDQPEKIQQNREGLANLESPENETQTNQTRSEYGESTETVNSNSPNRTIAANTIKAGRVPIEQVECPECSFIALNADSYSMQPQRMTNTLKTAPNVQSASYSGTSRTLSLQTEKSQSVLTKFTTGILLGPDFSTAGSVSDFQDPGSKIGFTVDYNLDRNWGISIGVIRSNVRYKAGQQDYRPPQGYWYNGIEAKSTTAECVLLDIPINLTYRFLHFNSSRIYASAGISSYIMLTEDYKFSYDNPYEEFPKRWKEKTGTTHFFSNAAISLGYEHDLFRGISIRAEPFMRLPLREVGWGNVNLYSIGSIFSVHFKLNKNQPML